MPFISAPGRNLCASRGSERGRQGLTRQKQVTGLRSLAQRSQKEAVWFT